MAAPAFDWGVAFANRWLLPGPIDNPRPISPAVMSVIESRSDEDDVWLELEREELLFEVPLIPRLSIGSVTGYSVANGAREALKWMRLRNVTRFFPDSSLGTYHEVKLIDFDFEKHVRRSQGGSRYTVDMKIRDVNGIAFTEY